MRGSLFGSLGRSIEKGLASKLPRVVRHQEPCAPKGSLDLALTGSESLPFAALAVVADPMWDRFGASLVANHRKQEIPLAGADPDEVTPDGVYHFPLYWLWTERTAPTFYYWEICPVPSLSEILHYEPPPVVELQSEIEKCAADVVEKTLSYGLEFLESVGVECY